MSNVYRPEAVDRWELSGGTWRVLSMRQGGAVIELLRCDGGEVVERLILDEAMDLSWARQQFSNRAAVNEGTSND